MNLAHIFGVIGCKLGDFTSCTLNAARLIVAGMGVGIIVACVPTLDSVFQSHRTAKKSSRHDRF